MPFPDITDIRIKMRRITKMLSPSQVTDPELDSYINSYVLFDFPETLRTFNLRKQFSFYTNPYIDSYTTNSTLELVDFKQLYISVHAPFYIGGLRANYCQSPEQFYNLYPAQTYKTQIATGDGVTLNFVGVLPNVPLTPNLVLFSSINAANDGLKLYDDGYGNLLGAGAGSTINYITGAYVLNFLSAPAPSAPISVQDLAYQPTQPTTVMFFHDTFTFRPIPDDVYKVTFEVQQRPYSTPIPELEENWELIAYEAARKLLTERGQVEQVANIESECEKLKLQALRRTIVQQQDMRSSTIFYSANSVKRGPFGY
jgi:hypothetical protein